MSIREDGSVEFNEVEQAAVDKIIGERLARESVHDKNEIIETLKEFGYEGTPAEIKAAVKAQAEEFRQQKAAEDRQSELEELQQQAKEEGTTPALLAEIKELKAKVSEIEGERTALKQTETQRIAAQKQIEDQVNFFVNDPDTKDIDLEKLNENPKFIKFLAKQKQTGKEDFLVEAYKDFVDLVGGAEARAIAKISSNLERSTASGREKGDSKGGTYGLTESQITACEDWNRKNPKMKMSYKEYSERL